MKELSEIKDWKEMVNEVVHGDCLQGMKMIPDKSIDLILTDPPYGVKMDKGFGGFGKPIARKRYEEDNWDSIRPNKMFFDELLRISKNAIIFGGNFFSDLLPQSYHWIVWDKLNTMPTFGDCELIWTNIDRKSVKKYTHEYNGLIGKEPWRKHPTQKPVELIRKILVDYSKEPYLICDPFMGSWTTARACKDLGRNFIGFELEEKYCKVGEERLRQQNLF
jgi:DNA modification methylase